VSIDILPNNLTPALPFTRVTPTPVIVPVVTVDWYPVTVVEIPSTYKNPVPPLGAVKPNLIPPVPVHVVAKYISKYQALLVGKVGVTSPVISTRVAEVVVMFDPDKATN
jgi:hypothetical protein